MMCQLMVIERLLKWLLWSYFSSYSFLEVFSAPFLSPSHLNIVVELEGFRVTIIVACRTKEFVGLRCDFCPPPPPPSLSLLFLLNKVSCGLNSIWNVLGCFWLKGTSLFSLRYWNHLKRKPSTSMVDWILGVQSLHLAQLIHRRRGEERK